MSWKIGFTGGGRKKNVKFAMFVIGVMTGMMIFGIYIIWMEEKD